MIRDVGAVIWKEMHEGLDRRAGGGRFGSAYTLIVTIGVLGLVIPLSIGAGYVGLPAVALTIAAALLVVMSIVPDSFAGERDRGTLETLLASRLPDRAILAGKIAAAALFAWAIAIAVLVISLVAVTIRDDPGAPSALEVVAALAGSLLAATAMASLGVLLSLRASSVQAAQQAMALTLAAGGLGLAAIATVLPSSWTGDLEGLAADLGEIDPALLVLIGAAILLALNLALLAGADLMFRRSRLVRPASGARARRRDAAAPSRR